MEGPRDGEVKTMTGEVRLNMPASKAWKIYRDNQIISKVNPSMLLQASYIQGDGNPGSLRLFQLGPAAVSSYVRESVQKIEKVEEGGKSSTYQVIGGQIANMYKPYRVTTSFVPIRGKEDSVCVAEWKAEFKPLSAAVPPPAKARDVALDFLACFDKLRI
ncbi:hypothetical protein V2J09_020870 [Rumex salicifolius]